MPSIRTSINSQNIHKDPKASSQFLEESRSENVSIHRRHFDNSRHKSLRQQLRLVSSTLTALGFALNTKKCILEPTQQIEFLGMMIDSKEMKIYLPKVKIEKIKKECRYAPHHNLTVRQMSHLIGLLISSHPAVHTAPLHIRALQRAKIQALRHGSYNLELDQIKDLQWWIQ